MFWFDRHNPHKLFADTALAVQIGNDKQPISIFEGTPASTQDPALRKNWNEFNTGMKMLQKYWQRFNARADKIACANLQLLHNNLRASTTYKDLLHDLKQYTRQHSFIYHWPLSETDDAGCSIIGFNRETTKEINLNYLLGNFSQRYFDNSTPRTAAGTPTYMYLVISGKLLVSRDTSELHRWNNDHQEKTYSITSYKSGDVLLMHENENHKIVDIRTNQKHTSLFGVYINEHL